MRLRHPSLGTGMTGLRISPDLELPLDAVTETIGILAVKRAGKSNAAVVLAEEMFDRGIPWVAIDPKGDWWGVRAGGGGTAPGLAVLVFGGQHGDVPLEPTAGRLVADLVVEQRITCVLDVSEMSKADQRRFLRDFADRLYRRNTEPLHVFCEEADEYIPQMVRGEAAQVVGAFETLVKRGGFKGIGVTLVTQRSASLNKDVLTQVGTLIMLRTTSPQDQKAVEGWIKYHAGAVGVLSELSGLDNGEAWVYSPSWLQTLQKVRFRKRRTFDSGATPKVGGKPRPPARLAEVDLAAIKEAMAATIEKAQAEDPKTLRARIRDLERQLAERPAAEPDRVEVAVLTDEQAELVADTIDRWDTATAAVDKVVDQLRLELQRIQTPVLDRSDAVRVGERGATVRTEFARPTSRTDVPHRVPRAPVEDGPSLGKTERRILSVLVQHGPRTHRQLALQTGYSAKASTIGVSLSKLRKLGYVEPGQPITATDDGMLALGDFEPLPAGPALLDYWRAQLGKTEVAILDTMLEAYPGELRQADIAARTGYSPTASTIGVALSKLRRLELVDGWKISDDFARSIR
jgi:hypothetical protein